MSTLPDNHGHKPLWRRMALPISIALNLFLVALIGGHVWHARSLAATGGSPFARALANAEASLSPQDAAAFKGVIRRDAPRYVHAQQQLTEARLEIARQILAEPYDPQKVQQAFAAWRIAWNGFFDDFGNTLVDALGQISPEGRRKLIAERRSERLGLPAPK